MIVPDLDFQFLELLSVRWVFHFLDDIALLHCSPEEYVNLFYDVLVDDPTGRLCYFTELPNPLGYGNLIGDPIWYGFNVLGIPQFLLCYLLQHTAFSYPPIEGFIILPLKPKR